MAGTKTYMAKSSEVQQKWWHVDGEGKVTGRLASDIATILIGKHRPTYTPHVDAGDYVIVTNADKIVLTGNKWQQKTYRWYTGYPGQKTQPIEQRFEKKPETILREAVRRMLPKNKLGKKMLDKLKIYTGSSHNHQAQTPETIELGQR